MLIILHCTGVAHCQVASTPEPSSSVYVSPSGYVGYSSGSSTLSGSGTRLEMRFRACSRNGLLLYTEDSASMAYFAVGLSAGQLLVESRSGSGTVSEVSLNIILHTEYIITNALSLSQFSSQGDPLIAGVWYTVTLQGLGEGGTDISLSIDGEQVQISNSEFPALSFGNFNGPLYIGGHPSLLTIGVSI